MANPTVTILLETVDKTAGGFNSILSRLGMSDEKIEQINNKLPGLAAKFTLVSAAIGAVVKFTKEAVEETIKYGDAMNDLSLVTGQPAEDMSRLAGAAERFGVDYKTLMSGLGTATKNGVDTSIDSLLNLADQYNSIKDPIQQAKFMTERFGAAGPEMAKIFRRGSDDIVAAMEDIRSSLAWGTDDQAVIDDYTYALVELKQTFTALKIEIGLAVIPVITGFLEILNGEGKTTLGSTQTEVEMLANKYSGLAGTAGGANIVLEDTAVRLSDIAVGSLGAQSGLEDVGTSAENNAGKILHFSNGAWSLVSGLNAIPKEIDSYVRVHYSFDGVDSRDAAEFAKPTLGEWNPTYTTTTKTVKSSGKGSVNARAYGGQVMASMPVITGEKGPELFVPHTSGHIIPNGQISGYGGGEMDYDRMARAFVEALERSSLVR